MSNKKTQEEIWKEAFDEMDAELGIDPSKLKPIIEIPFRSSANKKGESPESLDIDAPKPDE